MTRSMSLADIYSRIPAIACKGLCHGSCGPAPATRAEIAAMERASTVRFGIDASATCSMLFAGRCTVYEQRPVVCRAWGVTESMPCIFGCVPERVMSDAEGRSLLELAGKIGGGYDLERIVVMAETLAERLA